MSGYSDFARFYDALTSNIDYDKIAAYYSGLNEKFGGKKGILLDLACGTGKLSREMKKLGYDVIGIDASLDMLNVACMKEHNDIEFLCQNMTELDLYGTVDITISSLDSINHLRDTEDIFKTFKRISLFSNPGALFLFDLNTPYKHNCILAGQTFIYDLDDLYCIWQNSNVLDSNNKIEMYLDFFSSDGKGRFMRYYDEFSEIAPKLPDIQNMLELSDFEVLAVFEYMTERMISETSEKIVFVARKI